MYAIRILFLNIYIKINIIKTQTLKKKKKLLEKYFRRNTKLNKHQIKYYQIIMNVQYIFLSCPTNLNKVIQ